MGNGTLAKFGLENSLVFKADLRTEKYELFPSKKFQFQPNISKHNHRESPL